MSARVLAQRITMALESDWYVSIPRMAHKQHVVGSLTLLILGNLFFLVHWLGGMASLYLFSLFSLTVHPQANAYVPGDVAGPLDTNAIFLFANLVAMVRCSIT